MTHGHNWLAWAVGLARLFVLLTIIILIASYCTGPA